MWDAYRASKAPFVDKVCASHLSTTIDGVNGGIGWLSASPDCTTGIYQRHADMDTLLVVMYCLLANLAARHVEDGVALARGKVTWTVAKIANMRPRHCCVVQFQGLRTVALLCGGWFIS